jgi:hypothetical protein
MNIPNEITVGERTYKVVLHGGLIDDKFQGEVNYEDNTIKLATEATYDTPIGELNITFNDDEIENSFWHEMTHAVLHEMSHPLASNERFVTRFADILTNAIRSAKL